MIVGISTWIKVEVSHLTANNGYVSINTMNIRKYYKSNILNHSYDFYPQVSLICNTVLNDMGSCTTIQVPM
jgi:hypothetical protein